ncbi:TnpV protein [Marinisporobacter balticus]|uniref:TnpV protein n=1 Tax=Marinisporobacter balticus TaxID=2018667 RepID=UPI0038CBFC84
MPLLFANNIPYIETYPREQRQPCIAACFYPKNSISIYLNLLEIDQVANERLERLMPPMAKVAGITELLKATDQIKCLGLGLMNTIKVQVEETIFAELIYS